MKRSVDDQSLKEIAPPDNKRKCTEKKLCTPFCEPDCPFRGEHNEWIVSLVNLQEKSGINDWKASVEKAKNAFDFNQPLPDPVCKYRYPLLHWAAILGKVKAINWLLKQEFIVLHSNADDTASGPLSVSNETVLFSSVRFLHEGVKTREKFHIINVFSSILDAFLKYDPSVLLVEEERSKNTVLHVCAEGKENSLTPPFMYLKRLLGKLQEHYERNPKTPVSLRDLLGKRNDDGDAFVHVLAKNIKNKEARDVFKFAKEKFSLQYLENLKNVDEKTHDDIVNELKPDPEVYQTNSREIGGCFPGTPEGGEEDDESVSTPGSVDSRECSSTGEFIEEEPRRSLYPQDTFETSGQEREITSPSSQGYRRLKDLPSEIFPDSVSDGMSRSLDEVIGTRSHDSGSQEELIQENPVERVKLQPVIVTASSTREGIQASIDYYLNVKGAELIEANRNLLECQEKIKRLTEEEKKRKAVVQNLEKEINHFKSYLQSKTVAF